MIMYVAGPDGWVSENLKSFFLGGGNVNVLFKRRHKEVNVFFVISLTVASWVDSSADHEKQ